MATIHGIVASHGPLAPPAQPVTITGLDLPLWDLFVVMTRVITVSLPALLLVALAIYGAIFGTIAIWHLLYAAITA